MAIDSKNLLVWVKAMSRGQALPLDASEIHESLAAAQAYSETAIAYPGQTVKAKTEDGKYHEYILQPSESGYILEEVGAIKAEDLKQHVQIVKSLPNSGQEEGVLYLLDAESDNNPGGYIWINGKWKNVFVDAEIYKNNIQTVTNRVNQIDEQIETKAPIANPVFTGTVKVGTEEVAVKSYVDGLISNLKSSVPDILNPRELNSAGAEEVVFHKGYTYRVTEAGTVFGHECEAGDLVIVLNDFIWKADNEPSDEGSNPNKLPVNTPTNGPADEVMIIQSNIDGAVTSSADTSTVGEIVVFDAVTGKVIKGSGIQIASLNDAIAKAHEHSNKAKLDTYDKTQTELLAAAKTEAEGLVNTLNGTVATALNGKADKATTLAGYGITDAYNKTEIDGKVQTITENLNTKASSADVDSKIAAAKTETLEEAATATEEYVSLRLGSKIGEGTTVADYIDTAVGAGGTASAEAIATAKADAISQSKTYTDTKLAEALSVVNF